MAKPSVDISLKELEELAYQYIKECVEGKREYATGKGAVPIKERHIPTIDYFLRWWIPSKGKPSLSRTTYYDWLNYQNQKVPFVDDLPKEKKRIYEEHEAKSDTIKRIDELFKSVATDVVANEGKGIFYAKNRLGMTDKAEISGNPEQPLFSK